MVKKTQKPSHIFKGHPCRSEIRSTGSRMSPTLSSTSGAASLSPSARANLLCLRAQLLHRLAVQSTMISSFKCDSTDLLDLHSAAGGGSRREREGEREGGRGRTLQPT